MIISVIGSGYVGVTTAAIAAIAGYKVHLIDINPKRIDVLKSGKSFFYEEGINPLIKKAVDDGNLIPSTDYDGVKESSVIFSCVGTPDNPDGSSNLSYVFSSAETASKLMQDDAVYVQKSTVPVGTGKEASKLLKHPENYTSNPEFLREGTAVGDTLYFDRIVVGGPSEKARKAVINVYKDIEKNRDDIAKLAELDDRWKENAPVGQYIEANLESAELIKVTANAFLALKISFANNIAKLADASGANVVDVMDAVGADRRIGRAFFNAGRGYGGGCFPKDVSGLISSATHYGVEMPIMTAATDINASMPGYIAEKAQNALGSFEGKKIAVLGLAFKAGTSDARRSPGVNLANILDKRGASVCAYDPQANEEASEDLRKTVKPCSSVDEAITGVDAVLITTEWPEFRELKWKDISKKMAGSLIVDAQNVLNPLDIESAGLQYIGVGRG